MEEKLELSVIILTKNEEKNIKRALDSVKFAKEVIVFDSESTDNTCGIAKEVGARVIVSPWTGNYAEQRNKANIYATYDWILQIDADEWLSSGLLSEIKEFFLDGKSSIYDKAQFPRKELIFGKWINHGGWYPQYKLRLYRKNLGSWIGRVHERYEAEGRLYTFKNPLYHDSYKNIQTFINKFNHYSTIDAEQAIKNGEKFSFFKMIFQPIERFVGRFIFKAGYKDGFHGFVLAVLIALNYFLRHLKLWEFTKNEIQDTRL